MVLARTQKIKMTLYDVLKSYKFKQLGEGGEINTLNETVRKDMVIVELLRSENITLDWVEWIPNLRWDKLV